MSFLFKLYAHYFKEPEGKYQAIEQAIIAPILVALFLTVNFWVIFLVISSFFFFVSSLFYWIVFPKFFVVVLFTVILFYTVTRKRVMMAKEQWRRLDALERKQLRKQVWMYNLISVALFFVAIWLSPHIRPPKKIITANYNNGNEYKKFAAIYAMGESGDTSYVQYLMDGIDDPRVTLAIDFKGMSMGFAKTNVLEKIHRTSKVRNCNCVLDSIATSYWKARYPQYYKPYDPNYIWHRR